MSNKIRVLPPAIAERIAAGEVIERPASVVKELVENSIDAGAAEIAVLLEDGGKALIEVMDNGLGMSPDDLALCAQRHATSKLSTLDDLEKIRTLGFRGEAIPSIAAVSDLSLLSRAQGSETAYEATPNSLGAPFSARPATHGHFLNAAHGTRIQARGLFSQIPARLKFLKSKGSEVSHVRDWLERLALAHPKIGFKLIHDDRTMLNLRPGSELERVKEILSDGDDFPVLHSNENLSTGSSELELRLYWLQGLSSPQARKIAQVVNGRALRDRVLQQAALAPFRQALLPGHFPALALFIQIDPALIDVNVHPTKTEIRFLDSRRIFHVVQKLAESLIHRHGAPAIVPSFTSPAAKTESLFSGWSPAKWSPPPPWTASSVELPVSAPPISSPTVPAADSTPVELQSPSPAVQPLPSHQFVGILMNTYLIYDLGNELALIDQHAAHERIRYEKLRKRALSPQGAPHSQALLLPEAVRFSEGAASADDSSAPEGAREKLEARLPWLASMGFEAETFGEDTALFRSVPAEWGTFELRSRLKNLVERVLSYPSAATDLSMDERLFETLASEACHSAIRAGDRITREEALALVEELFRCEHPWNCPHGRPTLARVPRAKVEEWFLRRV